MRRRALGDKHKKQSADAHDPIASDGPEAPQAAAHPEELRASVTLRLGDWATVSASARATPAGIVAGGVALAAIMVPLIWIARRR